MDTLVEAAQPYVVTIITSVLGVVTTFVLIGVRSLQAKGEKLIEARTTATQREQLHKIAAEAFAFAQTLYKDYKGPEKLDQAISYASRQLADKRIDMSPEEIRAAIEKAYLDYSKTG